MHKGPVRKRIYIFNLADIGINIVTDVTGTETEWRELEEKLHAFFREHHRVSRRNRNWAIVDLNTREYIVYGSAGFARSIRRSFGNGGWRNQLIGGSEGKPEAIGNIKSLVWNLLPEGMVARSYRYDPAARVLWSDPQIERFVCLHLLSNLGGAGAPATWSVRDCRAVLSDGRVVKVELPFKEIPRGGGSPSFVRGHAARDLVNLQKIEFFKSIDNSLTAAEVMSGREISY